MNSQDEILRMQQQANVYIKKMMEDEEQKTQNAFLAAQQPRNDAFANAALGQFPPHHAAMQKQIMDAMMAQPKGPDNSLQNQHIQNAYNQAMSQKAFEGMVISGQTVTGKSRVIVADGTGTISWSTPIEQRGVTIFRDRDFIRTHPLALFAAQVIQDTLKHAQDRLDANEKTLNKGNIDDFFKSRKAASILTLAVSPKLFRYFLLSSFINSEHNKETDAGLRLVTLGAANKGSGEYEFSNLHSAQVAALEATADDKVEYHIGLISPQDSKFCSAILSYPAAVMGIEKSFLNVWLDDGLEDWQARCAAGDETIKENVIGIVDNRMF